jgi:hypothetical protein
MAPGPWRFRPHSLQEEGMLWSTPNTVGLRVLAHIPHTAATAHVRDEGYFDHSILGMMRNQTLMDKGKRMATYNVDGELV